MNAKELIGKVKEAVKRFGEHNLQDKGAYEVMDFDPIISDLKSMKPEEVRKVLEEVYNHDHNCAVVVTDLVGSLDDLPEDIWDRIVTSSPILSTLY